MAYIPDDIPAEKKVKQVDFDKLKAKGYSGGQTIEEVMKPLNEAMFAKGQKYINGQPWWVVEKNKKVNEGKDFKDIIVGELDKELSK